MTGITEEQIIKRLKALQEIEPDIEYARASRYRILSLEGRVIERADSPLRIFSQSLNFIFSLTLVAAVFIVILLGGAFSFLRSAFLPPLQGVDNKTLLTEADSISKDIDIRLKEINYFEEVRPSVALGGRGSTVLGGPKLSSIAEGTTDHEIDKLLDRVIRY